MCVEVWRAFHPAQREIFKPRFGCSHIRGEREKWELPQGGDLNRGGKLGGSEEGREWR